MVEREGTHIRAVVPAAGRVSVLPDLPRADLSTELLAKGGAPLPIESKKELSNFRYSMALENSLKQEARQTFRYAVKQELSSKPEAVSPQSPGIFKQC